VERFVLGLINKEEKKEGEIEKKEVNCLDSLPSDDEPKIKR
jgi:hypothetical protein